MIRCPKRWNAAEVSFELLGDMTDAPVITIQAFTPIGELLVTGEPVVQGRVLL